MPVATKANLNTLAWVGQWLTQPKLTSSVDNVRLAVHQVFRVASPADLLTRAGVDYLVKVDDANDNVPDAQKGIWLRGADMWSYLVNHASSIPGPTGAGTFNPSATPYELTYEQGRAVANFIPLVGYIAEEYVGEGYLRENGWQTSADHVSVFEQGVVARLKERFAAANKPFFYKCQYGAFYTFWHRIRSGFKLNPSDANPVSPTNSFFQSLLQSRTAARAACNFFALNYDTLGMAHDIKFYAEDFQSRHHFYYLLYALRVCVFGTTNTDGSYRNRVILHFWAKVEQLNDGLAWALHNGFYYRRRIDSKGGTVVSSEHPQMDHEFLLAAQVFTYATGILASGEAIAGVHHWENSEIFGTNAEYMTQPNPTPTPERANYVAWVPDASQPAPYSASVLGYPESPMGYMDLGPRAKLLYNTTVNTAGVKWSDCKYKCEERLTSSGWVATGEDWVTPKSDGTTVLDWAAMYDGVNATTGPNKVRGGLCAVVREKVSGGQKHVSIAWYHPGRGPMVKEKYLFETPTGLQIRATVQGATVEVFNESYAI